jgi:hypothetical protein
VGERDNPIADRPEGAIVSACAWGCPCDQCQQCTTQRAHEAGAQRRAGSFRQRW